MALPAGFLMHNNRNYLRKPVFWSTPSSDPAIENWLEHLEKQQWFERECESRTVIRRSEKGIG